MSSSGEMTSKSSDNLSRHPIQASESSLGVADIDPGAGQEEIAVRMTGAAPHGQRQDDGTYIANSDGIPFPDSAHSKNVGGVLVASDQFLFEKLQRFNRSKTLGHKKPLCSTLSLFFVVFYQFLFEILQRFNRSKTLGRKKLLCSTLSLFFVVS